MAEQAPDFSSKYDFVLVFPWSLDDSHPRKPYVVDTVRKISEAGLEIFSYLSIQNDEVFQGAFILFPYIEP